MGLQTTNERDLAELVQTKLAEKSAVRPFPAAVSQLLAAFQDANSTSATFAKIIECDPGLAMHLLRLANSPLYGLSRDVRSISHATALLGIRSLRTLAMSVAGSVMFSQGTSKALEREALWIHSLGVAAIARVLADFDPAVSPDDAFLASVFHDVGKLLLYDVVPEEYSQMNRKYFGAELIAAEKDAFGLTHSEIGLRSALSWNLSEDLAVAIRYHHEPATTTAHVQLTSLVSLANELSTAWGIGYKCEPDSELTEEILSRPESDEKILEIVKQQAQSAFADIQNLCW